MGTPLTLAAYMGLVGESLSELTNDRCRRLWEKSSESLPPARVVGFEAALRDFDGSVDLCVCFQPEDPAFSTLQRNAWGPGGESEKMWEGLGRFLRTADSLITDLWLEFDLDTLESLGTSANVFWRFTRPQETDAILRQLPLMLSDLTARPTSKELMASLQSLLLRLPAGCCLSQVGCMLPRNMEGLRICVEAPTPGKISELLTKLGWRGDADSLVSIAQEVGGHLTLDLDLMADGIGPAVGVEFLPTLELRPELGEEWSELFDCMLNRGLCSKTDLRHFKSWPGGEIHEPGASTLPSPLRKISSAFGLSVVVLRGLSHAKLVIKPNRQQLAKIYFGFNIHWVATDQVPTLHQLN